jgi:hypothetical protein
MAQPEAESVLVSALQSLREKAVSLQGRRGLNEKTTKAALIIPLLTALGGTPRTRSSAPVPVFIEAKSLGHDITDRWTNQIVSCSYMENREHAQTTS